MFTNDYTNPHSGYQAAGADSAANKNADAFNAEKLGDERTPEELVAEITTQLAQMVELVEGNAADGVAKRTLKRRTVRPRSPLRALQDAVMHELRMVLRPSAMRRGASAKPQARRIVAYRQGNTRAPGRRPIRTSRRVRAASTKASSSGRSSPSGGSDPSDPAFPTRHLVVREVAP
jgi:hypothetical protein